MRLDDNLFKVVKWFMIIAGTWENELVGVSNTWKKIYKIYSIVIFLAYHSCHVSFLLRLYEILGEDNDKAIELLSMFIILSQLAIKMALCRTKQMTTVIKNAIEKDIITGMDGDGNIKNIFSSYSRYANVLNIALAISAFTVGQVLFIGCLVEEVKFKKTHDADEEVPLQIQFWYPFNPNNHYGWVQFYQCFVITFTDIYFCSLQSLLNTIMIQVSADFKVLMYSFRTFTKDMATGQEVTEEKAHLNLIECIRTHQKLIIHIQELDKAIKYTLLIEYGISSVMLASILLQVIGGQKTIFNSLEFGIFAFQWFMLCWNANEIQLQSEELSMSLYETNWYVQSKSTKQLIYIIVERTKRPLFLHIGPFGAMTLDAAISRVKLAYSYVSLMS